MDLGLKTELKKNTVMREQEFLKTIEATPKNKTPSLLTEGRAK